MSGLETYLVDVRPLLAELGVAIMLDADIAIGPIEIGATRFVPLTPAHLDGHLTSTGAGIVLGGTLSLTAEAVCSRCLCEFPLEVTTEVDGFYIERGQEAELPEEQEFAYVVEGSVDIAEAIMTALALELPFAPLHAADCPGICAQCGADLSQGACSCAPSRPASPFAALVDVFPDETEK